MKWSFFMSLKNDVEFWYHGARYTKVSNCTAIDINGLASEFAPNTVVFRKA